MTRWSDSDDPEVWAQRMAYVRAQALKKDDGLTDEERRRIVEEYERTYRIQPGDTSKLAEWLKKKREEK